MSADKVNNKKLTINNFDKLIGQNLCDNYIIYATDWNDTMYKIEARYYHTIGLLPHEIQIVLKRTTLVHNQTSTNIYWTNSLMSSTRHDAIYTPMDKLRDMRGWLKYMSEEMEKLMRR